MIKILWDNCFREFSSKDWYFNIIHFPKNFYRFIGEFLFFIKHGYPRYAEWNINDYFIDIMKPLLIALKDNNNGGYPSTLKNDEEWRDILQNMIDLLGCMRTSDYNTLHPDLDLKKLGREEIKTYIEKRSTTLANNKDEFFRLFSQWFYNLWD